MTDERTTTTSGVTATTGTRDDLDPLDLPERSVGRAFIASFGAFGALMTVWIVLTAIIPDFHASTSSPLTYVVVVGSVLLLFGALVAGQIRTTTAWLGSLAEVDGISRGRVRAIGILIAAMVVVGVVGAVAIFIYTQAVWMPEVRSAVQGG